MAERCFDAVVVDLGMLWVVLVLVDRTRRVSVRCWRMTARRPRLRWKFSPRSSLKVSKLLKVTAIELQSYSSAAKQ